MGVVYENEGGELSMKTRKLVVGAILLLIGLWMIFSLDNSAARWIGGGIVVILGVAKLVMGYKGEGKKEQVQPEPVKPIEEPVKEEGQEQE